MKRSYLIGLTSLIAACGPKVSEPPKNCASPPSGFWSYNNEKFWEGKPIPIMPESINTITVQKDEKTELSGLHDRTVANWNGIPIDLLTIETYLKAVADFPPGMGSYTNLDFERGVPCHRVVAIRQVMAKHLKCTQDRVCLQGYQPPIE